MNMRGCKLSSKHTKKRFANAQKRELRAIGFKARVTKVDGKYAVMTCGKLKRRRRF